MKSTALIVASSFIAALALPAYAQQNKASSADAKAIRDLAQANMAEVETGKLAAEKAQNAEVKKFAQHMVDEHGKMLQEVQQLAQSKGVDLPTEPNRKQQSAKEKLGKASGQQFDKEYVSLMVKDHSEDVKEVEKIARNAKDGDVKNAAQSALPHIKEHLQMVQQLAAQGAGASRGASARPREKSR